MILEWCKIWVWDICFSSRDIGFVTDTDFFSEDSGFLPSSATLPSSVMTMSSSASILASSMITLVAYVKLCMFYSCANKIVGFLKWEIFIYWLIRISIWTKTCVNVFNMISFNSDLQIFVKLTQSLLTLMTGSLSFRERQWKLFHDDFQLIYSAKLLLILPSISSISSKSVYASLKTSRLRLICFLHSARQSDAMRLQGCVHQM